MSFSVTVFAALILLMLPLEQSAAQRRTQSGVSRDTSVSIDSSAAQAAARRQCAYDTFWTRTLLGAAIGLVSYVPFGDVGAWNQSWPVSTTVIATTIIGATIGVYEAKRDCISRSPPRYRSLF